MIERLILHNFKAFREEVFELDDNLVLAGPNNSGKSTLLQAISVWSLALRKWLEVRGPESGSKAKKRTGLGITRKDFTAIPLREMNLLWTNRSTALTKDEVPPDKSPGAPRALEICVEGRGLGGPWQVALEFIYRYPELVHVRPSEATPVETICEQLGELQVVHVPPFSGIGSDETHYDRAYQDLLIGQGKPGDILRNLLLEVHNERPSDWERLCRDVEEIFGCQLLTPLYEGRPFIVCEYVPASQSAGKQRRGPKLDISCAGSGFLQVLMLLGFFYARPASILLLDEPDAHLHVILQKQVYDTLRGIAREKDCQLLIATHSEVLIDGTAPERILSFVRRPHRLVRENQRDSLREAIKRLTSVDILLAEECPGILYVEGESDLNLLREWARVWEHSVHDFLARRPFWHPNQGRNPREARAHLFALQSVRPDIRGILLLDGDNRRLLSDHELSAEGLTILRWKRYEAESYLLHPDALARFVQKEQHAIFAAPSAENGLEFLRNELPPAVYKHPLKDHDYLNVTPASKTLLPGFFEAAEYPLTKNEYYQIAAQMKRAEIPEEVREKLDLIWEALGQDPAAGRC